MSTIATIFLSALRARTAPPEPGVRGRWGIPDIEALYSMPFLDLLFRAQQVHREHFDANEVQLSTLLSIKTGGCFRGLWLLPAVCPL